MPSPAPMPVMMVPVAVVRFDLFQPGPLRLREIGGDFLMRFGYKFAHALTCVLSDFLQLSGCFVDDRRDLRDLLGR